jgi:galactokinase
MKKKVFVSTPSRICLFGEHQDYLGLEVIASAINLRFYASASSRDDKIIRIKTSWGKLD